MYSTVIYNFLQQDIKYAHLLASFLLVILKLLFCTGHWDWSWTRDVIIQGYQLASRLGVQNRTQHLLQDLRGGTASEGLNSRSGDYGLEWVTRWPVICLPNSVTLLTWIVLRLAALLACLEFDGCLWPGTSSWFVSSESLLIVLSRLLVFDTPERILEKTFIM